MPAARAEAVAIGDARTAAGSPACPDGEAIGCAAMRPLGGGVCEMKRLHVAPAGRGLGFVPVAAYHDTPVAGTVFRARPLGRRTAGTRA